MRVLCRFTCGFLPVLLVLVTGGCATTAERIPNNFAEFKSGIDAIIEPGMPIKEVRRRIVEVFPPPTENSESTPIVSGGDFVGRNRRYVMMWQTRTPGTIFVVTIECDRNSNVARWAVGPLTSENPSE